MCTKDSRIDEVPMQCVTPTLRCMWSGCALMLTISAVNGPLIAHLADSANEDSHLEHHIYVSPMG